MISNYNRLLPAPIVMFGLSLTAGAVPLAHSVEAVHDSHWSGDLRVGANMDLTAETRDFGADMNRQVLDLREVEVSLESQIKPWLYGMIFLTQPSDEDMSIEEAAVIADLPNGFRLKAGKYRNEFGLINTVHEPERPQVSLPLPVEEFLGEEQLRETAVTLGRLTDLGNGYRAGISGAVFNSDNDAALDAGQSGDKAFGGKLYFGRQAGDAAYQLGLSALTGKNDTGGTTDIQALDFRVLLEPEFARGYDYSARFSWMGEILFNQREIAPGVSNNANGAWTLVDYQFKPAHHLGAGAEYTQGRLDKSLTSRAYSAHYSWYYSPHARLQLQARRLDVDGGDSGMEVLLQWNIVLGAHSERPFLAILPVDEKM